MFCGTFDCSGIPAATLATIPNYYLTYLGPTNPVNKQQREDHALRSPMRNTRSPTRSRCRAVSAIGANQNVHGCGNDGGDGTWSAYPSQIQELLQLLNGTIGIADYLQPGAPGGLGVNLGPYACSTTGPGPLFHPLYFTNQLNENNISWRAGVNWKAWEARCATSTSAGLQVGQLPRRWRPRPPPS